MCAAPVFDYNGSIFADTVCRDLSVFESLQYEEIGHLEAILNIIAPPAPLWIAAFFRRYDWLSIVRLHEDKIVLWAMFTRQKSGMPEAESAPEVAAKELPIPAPEIEKQFEAEQKTAPPMQTEPAPVHPTQSESAPEPIANDNELADMVYVPGFGWIESQGPNHVEYAEDMYENGNKIGIMG